LNTHFRKSKFFETERDELFKSIYFLAAKLLIFMRYQAVSHG
jgi:hypothetical protein